MTEDFKNKIQRLELENFTCFAKAEMDFSSGINVFIGENGTGKTHVLKVLYASVYQDEIFNLLLKDKDFIKKGRSFNIQTNLTSFFKNNIDKLSKNSSNFEIKAFFKYKSPFNNFVFRGNIYINFPFGNVSSKKEKDVYD